MSTIPVIPAAPENKPRLGKAVINGIVQYLSVSAIQKFNPESDGGCPRRWYYQYIMGKKEPSTPALELGIKEAKNLEIYLKTGEDVLTMITRPGKKYLPLPGPDLEVEQLLGDTVKATAIRLQMLEAIARCETGGNDGADVFRATELAKELDRVAGLSINGIPLTGAMDYRHRRGEFIDSDGVLKRETIRGIVEIGDHKTTSDIDAWGKTPEKLALDIQMVGYGVNTFHKYPDLTHERFSHNQYQTKGAHRGEKSTIVVPIENVLKRWDSLKPLVTSIEQSAKETDIKHVEPQPTSCRAFGKDCPHMSYCPKSSEQSRVTIFGKSKPGENPMSLFHQAQSNVPAAPAAPQQTLAIPPAVPNMPTAPSIPAAPVTATVPPPVPAAPVAAPTVPAIPIAPAIIQNDAAYQAKLEAEKARLRAEQNGTPAPATTPPAFVPMPVTACDLDSYYLVDCGDNAPPRRMQYRGYSNGHYVFLDSEGGRSKLEANANVFETAPPIHVGSILPPDAAHTTFLNGSAVIPQSEIDKLKDPELKARAELHARLSAEAAAASNAEKLEKASGRCTYKEKILLTPLQIAAKKLICPQCGAERKNEKVQEGDQFYYTFTSHNKPKTEVSVTTVPPPVPNVPPAVPAVPAAPAATTVPPPVPASPVAAPAVPAAPSMPVQAPAAPSVPVPPVVVAPAVPVAPAAPAAPVETPPAAPLPAPVPVQATTPIAGLELYVNVIAEHGLELVSFDSYILPMVRALESHYNVPDLRCAPSDSPLAYSAWQGVLASYCRTYPPAPGKYVIRNPSKIASVVIETVAPRCSVYMRGV